MQPRAAKGSGAQESQGGRLARLTREAGLTDNELAGLSGVRRGSIRRIVNDHAGLGPTLAKRLAPPLGVTVEELLVGRDPEVEARRGLERRLRELEEDRDYLLDVVRQLLAHLEKAGVGAPHVPAAPRSAASVARAPGFAAQDGTERVEVAPGQRRPQLRRHR